MNNKMDISEPEKLTLKLGSGGRNVQSDHAQNDPTKPDYIKNRLAYYCRKFEDIEAVEYPEPITADMVVEQEEEIDGKTEIVTYSQPVFLKIAELPENATPSEIIEEAIGLGMNGEEMRLDDPEMFPPEMLQYFKREEIFDGNGQPIGAYFAIDVEPIVAVISADSSEWNYIYRYEDDGEIYEESFLIRFLEKGIYTIIQDYEEDDEGNIVKYYTFDKILFRDVVRLDKQFLPPELLKPQIELDSSPQSGSENAITSGAVYSLKTTHENRMVQIEKNHNSLSNTVSGHTTSIINLNTSVSKKMPDIPVTTDDNGKIPMVVNGSWTAVEIPFVEEGEY